MIFQWTRHIRCTLGGCYLNESNILWGQASSCSSSTKQYWLRALLRINTPFGSPAHNNNNDNHNLSLLLYSKHYYQITIQNSIAIPFISYILYLNTLQSYKNILKSYFVFSINGTF